MSTFHDGEGDLALRLTIARSKTDQFNPGHEKILKATDHELCPVKVFHRWSQLNPTLLESDNLVFPPNIRKTLACALKLAGSYVGLDHSRIGNHSLRSGGATLMFTAGFDIEIIKRWGRWLSPTFHTYIWRDEHILSHIGRGMLRNTPGLPGRAGGKRGISQVSPNTHARHMRLVEISKTMSGALRHRELPTMTEEGWTTVKVVCNLPRLQELHTTMGDIRLIVNGEGDNWKRRFELSPDGRCIRCAQGHSVGSGVRPDVLPIETKLKFLIHGTSLRAAKAIAKEGLSRCSRLHVHFYECDRRGIVLGGNVLRHGAEVGIVILASHCMEDGIIFRRASNDVILTEGVDGVVGPQYIRFVCKMLYDPYASRPVIWERSNPIWHDEINVTPTSDRVNTDGSNLPSIVTRSQVDDDEIEEEEATEESAEGTASDSDDELTLDELSARMEDEQRRSTLPLVKLEAIEGLNPFSESECEVGTAGTRSENWEEPVSGAETEIKSECEWGGVETEAYTATPNLGDQVKADEPSTAKLEGEEEAESSDADIATALLDQKTLKRHALRNPMTSASVFTRPNQECGRSAPTSSSRDLSPGGRTTPIDTPNPSPRRGSEYGLRTPSSLGSPRVDSRRSSRVETVGQADQGNQEETKTTEDSCICPECLYTKKRGHSPKCRRNPDLVNGRPPGPVPEKSPVPKRKSLTKAPPAYLLLSAENTQCENQEGAKSKSSSPVLPSSSTACENAEGAKTKFPSPSAARVRPSSRSVSADSRGRGGSSDSKKADQPQLAPPQRKLGGRKHLDPRLNTIRTIELHYIIWSPTVARKT